MPVNRTFENSSLNERSVAALVVIMDEGVAILLPVSKRLVVN